MTRAERGPTLEGLRERREEILRVASLHGVSNVRIVGSVARGEADAESDVDVLVDVDAEAHGFAYFGLLDDLRHALTELLGRDVDVLDAAGLQGMRDQVLKDAVPL